jgi:hypothetical protein
VPVEGPHQPAGANDVRIVGPWDGECAIGGQPGGDDDRVERLAQPVQREIPADLDVAEELHALALEETAELLGDLLRALMIRRDPVAHKPVRGGEAVDHHDLRVRQPAPQHLGRVAPGRPRADDRDRGARLAFLRRFCGQLGHVMLLPVGWPRRTP